MELVGLAAIIGCITATFALIVKMEKIEEKLEHGNGG